MNAYAADIGLFSTAMRVSLGAGRKTVAGADQRLVRSIITAWKRKTGRAAVTKWAKPTQLPNQVQGKTIVWSGTGLVEDIFCSARADLTRIYVTVTVCITNSCTQGGKDLIEN